MTAMASCPLFPLENDEMLLSFFFLERSAWRMEANLLFSPFLPFFLLLLWALPFLMERDCLFFPSSCAVGFRGNDEVDVFPMSAFLLFSFFLTSAMASSPPPVKRFSLRVIRIEFLAPFPPFSSSSLLPLSSLEGEIFFSLGSVG